MLHLWVPSNQGYRNTTINISENLYLSLHVASLGAEQPGVSQYDHQYFRKSVSIPACCIFGCRATRGIAIRPSIFPKICIYPCMLHLWVPAAHAEAFSTSTLSGSFCDAFGELFALFFALFVMLFC